MQGREIKFRGKRKDNGEWVYGNLVLTAYGCYIIPQNIYADSMPQFSVDPETVGQFTGLRDKNDREIYEGDVFRTSLGHVAIVEWEKEGRFLGFTIDRSILYINREPAVEVIGNIYEKPELLEVGK